MRAHPVWLSEHGIGGDDGWIQDHPVSWLAATVPGAPEPSGDTAVVLLIVNTLSLPPHTFLCPDTDQMGR